MKKLLGLLLLIGCSDAAPQLKPSALSSGSLISERLQILDERFDGETLCEDYRLVKALIASLQNSPNLPRLREDCPRNYREFIQFTKEAIESLNDLHTQVAFGNGLDTQTIPVIKRCEGSAQCRSLIGSPLHPVPSTVQDAFFAASFASPTEVVPWEILSVDGILPIGYKDAMNRDSFYSHSKSNWSSQLSAYLLRRDAISSRSRADMKIHVRNIQSGDDVQLLASFEKVQTVFGSKDLTEILQNMTFDRAYGCADVLPGSNFKMGACRTRDAQTVAWLGEWPQAPEFKAWSDALASWLKPEDALIKLDFRGNGGGSPVSVLNFFCSFGDQKAVDVLDAQSLNIRVWPSTFEIARGIVHTDKLEILDNKPLVRIDADFAIEDASTERVRSFSMSQWERAKVDRASCEGQRLPAFANVHWQILTDGNEFSAAEDFLFVAREAFPKFQIIGRPSVGGSGNPSWITLPYTKTGVRLSPSRTLYQGKMVIEGKGVAPSIPLIEQESSQEFQARLKAILQKPTLVDFASDHRSRALRAGFFESVSSNPKD